MLQYNRQPNRPRACIMCSLIAAIELVYLVSVVGYPNIKYVIYIALMSNHNQDACSFNLSRLFAPTFCTFSAKKL